MAGKGTDSDGEKLTSSRRRGEDKRERHGSSCGWWTLGVDLQPLAWRGKYWGERL